jgi:hypothetical protein
MLFAMLIAFTIVYVRVFRRESEAGA